MAVDTFFDPMVKSMHSKLLRYAVQRAMLCSCGDVLDYRKNAVLVGDRRILCLSCWDTLKTDDEVIAAAKEHPTVEVNHCKFGVMPIIDAITR